MFIWQDSGHAQVEVRVMT